MRCHIWHTAPSAEIVSGLKHNVMPHVCIVYDIMARVPRGFHTGTGITRVHYRHRHHRGTTTVPQKHRYHKGPAQRYHRGTTEKPQRHHTSTTPERPFSGLIHSAREDFDFHDRRPAARMKQHLLWYLMSKQFSTIPRCWIHPSSPVLPNKNVPLTNTQKKRGTTHVQQPHQYRQ